MDEQEIERLANIIVVKLEETSLNNSYPASLTVHILEHEVLGGGRVINEKKARATPCTCFSYEGEEYCWSPGILGLLSSQKNPEQITEYCALGKSPGGEGVKKRFAEIKSAVSEAHQEWQANGGSLESWWDKIAKKMQEKGLEFA
jgi:hypothetical protein